MDNKHWGNIISQETPPNVLQIVSKNVNSLNTDDDFVDWKAAIDALAELQASIICLQETNLHWQPDIHLQIRQIICNSTLHTSHFNTLNTTECNKSTNYQPGRTFIATFGPWVSRINHSGTDASGMGRWSYLELEGRSNQKNIIVSRYRACSQNP